MDTKPPASASSASVPIELNPGQQQALDAIKAFLQSTDQIFILKGSAGTGKTTLVQAVCQYLKANKTSFKLTATTGRAAKVLSSKTGNEASTLHSTLYVFDEVAGQDTSGADPWESKSGQLFLNFGLRNSLIPEVHPKVIIVDEASMISHLTQKGTHTAVFGSGNLLNDLLAFAGSSKIIFVGDACQLPPVAEASLSAALSLPYWKERNIKAQEYELTHIVRQQAGNEILHIAGFYRQKIVLPSGERPASFPLPQNINVYALLGQQLFLQGYLKLVEQGGLPNAVSITYTNQHAFELNKYIRQQLHGQYELQKGEVLMVVQNSYNVNLVNGDQVIVEKVSYDSHRAGFTFLNIYVRSIFTGEVHQTKLIKNLLYNAHAGLGPDETRNLLIDFDHRMREQGIGRNSADYKNKMLKDEYLNAIRAKFGYAITVHKAQGGEWDNVFLYLHSSIYSHCYQADGLDKFYRWFYTAVTRAREKLVVNDGTLVEGFSKRHPEEAAKQWKEIQRKNNKRNP